MSLRKRTISLNTVCYQDLETAHDYDCAMQGATLRDRAYWVSQAVQDFCALADKVKKRWVSAALSTEPPGRFVRIDVQFAPEQTEALEKTCASGDYKEADVIRTSIYWKCTEVLPADLQKFSAEVLEAVKVSAK